VKSAAFLVVGVLAATTLTTIAPANAAAATAEEEELSDIRLRVGGSLFGGAFLGAIEKPGGGISGRLGAQIGRRYAVYAQPLWMFSSYSYLGGSGAMFEMTFLDAIYVAGGPEVLFGRIRDTFEAFVVPAVRDHYFFALSTRTGIAFGDRSPVRRTGFTLGLDLRVVFDSKILYTPLIAFGFDAF
jgi:hypothetical protein